MALGTSVSACNGLHFSDPGLACDAAAPWRLGGIDLAMPLACGCLAATICLIVWKGPERRTRRLLGVAFVFGATVGLWYLVRFLFVWLPLATSVASRETLATLATVGAALLVMKRLRDPTRAPSRAELGGLVRRLQDELLERAAAQKTLQAAHDTLEDRVRERTAELRSRNAELQDRVVEHDRIEAAFRDTQRILDSAQRLALSNAGFDKRKATADLLTLLAELHPFPASAMYRLDRRSGRFVCVALHGLPLEGLSCFQLPEGALLRASQTGETAVLPCADHTRDPRQAHAEEDFAQALIVPVMYQEACLSVLVLAGKRLFTPAELSFVEILRSQLGVAQHNLRLYVDSRRLATELHVRNIEIAQKNLQLQDISRTKSEFVANMSHELRTPLNAVLGFTGTLLMRLPGPLTADQEKQLRTVQASARHLLSLINDLLDVEKIESGKFDIRLEDVVLQSVIRDVFDTLQPLAAQKKLAFTMSLPETEITIQTDRRAVSQVLLNLLNNAIKFTERGQVSLELSRRRTETAGTVELQVSDTGIGILPDRQDQLFQPFTQLDASASRSFDGTGLGLYLSRRLATLVGGRLQCRSEYGKGSVFTLALPLRQA